MKTNLFLASAAVVTTCLAMSQVAAAYERIINPPMKFGEDWGFEPVMTDEDLSELAVKGVGGEPIRFLDIEVVYFNPKASSQKDEHSLFSVTWVKNRGVFKADWTYALYHTEAGVRDHTSVGTIHEPGPNYRIMDIEFTMRDLEPIYTVIYVHNVGAQHRWWAWIPATLSWNFEDVMEKLVDVTANSSMLGIVDTEVEFDEFEGFSFWWQCGVLVENSNTAIEIFSAEQVEQISAVGFQILDVERWPMNSEQGGALFLGILIPSDSVWSFHHSGLIAADVVEIAASSPPQRIIDFEPNSPSSSDWPETIWEAIFDPPVSEAVELGFMVTIEVPAVDD